jgi:hypothetical protein
MKIKDQRNRTKLERHVRAKESREPRADKKDAGVSSFRDLLQGKSDGEKKAPEGRLAAEKEPNGEGADELVRTEREDNNLQDTALHGRQQRAEKGEREQREHSFQERREVETHETRDKSHQRLEHRHRDRLTERRESPGEARAHDQQDSSNPAERASPGDSRRASAAGGRSPAADSPDKSVKNTSSDDGAASSLAAEKSLEAVGANNAVGAEQMNEVGQASSPESARRQEVAELAGKLVRACQVGQDQQQRKVMMLDVRVPGRGNIRVRLRQEGDGISVRMRADNDELKSLLRSHQGVMRDTANEQGVSFTRIDVV